MTGWVIALALAAGPAPRTAAEQAFDAQDRARLEQVIAGLQQASDKAPADAAAHHRLAEARLLLAQLGMELGDKGLARTAGEAGIPTAKKAVDLKGDSAEYRRVLGALCAQVIPANPMSALKWGKCAGDEINKATQLNPKSAKAWLSHGVGNYYLPPAFGGGVDKAVADLRKAVQLEPALAEAHLWLGLALRKSGNNAEARKSIEKSLELNPARKWARTQLEKTPAQ